MTELFDDRPNEVYRETTCEGKEVTMEVFGEKFHLRDRFNTFAVIDNAELAFDFFRNYVPLLEFSELIRGWDCYKRACEQEKLPKAEAFWQYLG